jgi:uncharacterized protein YutE (UPF0331/DUF86 family)
MRRKIDILENNIDEFIKNCQELNGVTNLETDRQLVSFVGLMVVNKLNILLLNNDISIPDTFYKSIKLCVKYKLISQTEAKNINALRRLRNKFTHTLTIRNFEEIETINYKDFYYSEYENIPKKDIFRSSIIHLLVIDTGRKINHFTNKDNKDVFKITDGNFLESFSLFITILKDSEIKEMINSLFNKLKGR